MKTRTIVGVCVAIVISELAGIVGSLFTTPAITGWYQTLVKPSFNPPNFIFGPVWTILFALMGIAAYLVWRKGWNTKGVKLALGLFTLQLVLNILWSILFFGNHNPGAGLIEIIFLWIAIMGTIISFFKVSKVTFWLLLPYILWVTFAALLNYAIFTLN